MNRGSLTIRYNAPLGFGAHTLRFYFREGKHVQLLAETELHNDGANLGDQNLQLVEMVPGRWQLILNGQEQPEERWLVEVGESAKMKKLQPPPPESAP